MQLKKQICFVIWDLKCNKNDYDWLAVLNIVIWDGALWFLSVIQVITDDTLVSHQR